MLREIKPKTTIIFLGNPIFKDDKIGLILGARLKERLEENFKCKVEILEKVGFQLIDYVEGFDTVIVVDSIKTGEHDPGDIVVFRGENLKSTAPLTPHYSGIPETLQLMKALGLRCPKKFYMLCVEVVDPYTISEELTPTIKERLDDITCRVYREIGKLLESQE